MAQTFSQIYIQVVLRRGKARKNSRNSIIRNKLIPINCMPDHAHLPNRGSSAACRCDLMTDVNHDSFEFINETLDSL